MKILCISQCKARDSVEVNVYLAVQPWQLPLTRRNPDPTLPSLTTPEIQSQSRNLNTSSKTPPTTAHLDTTTPSVKMKLNISYPANGSQKLIDVEDERKLRVFMDRRMGQEVPADSVGDEWKGYILRITGGNDKQGFPMKQGVMHPTRVRLLLADGHSCYRPRRTGERKRKSVRGCIVGMDLSVLALSIVKQGEEEIPGLTDTVHPKRLGPKRATKIRKFFGLSKEDDVSALSYEASLLLFASQISLVDDG